MLIKPIHARCDNRNQLSPTHSSAGDPSDWLASDFLSEVGMYNLSFDFFVNWQRNNIPKILWQKRLVSPATMPWPIDNLDILQGWVEQIDSETELARLTQFCDKHQFTFYYYLFKEATNWLTNPTEVVELRLPLSNTTARSLVLSPSDIKKRVRYVRGIPVPIGPNGLIYAYTSLECFLAKNPNGVGDIWPGDADAVLIDATQAIKGIVEYKKHTLNSPISSQTLMNYRDKDKRKYESLGLFRDHFGTTEPTPIIMIYYPTKEHIQQVKIEKLTGSFDDLQVCENKVVDLPSKADAASCLAFAKEIAELL